MDNWFCPFLLMHRIYRTHSYLRQFNIYNIKKTNRIVGVIVSVLALNVVDWWFKLRWGRSKYYKIGICCFCTKHTALRRKSKDWLAQNQNNVSEWGWHAYLWTVVSVSWHYKNPAKRVGLVQSGSHHHLIKN